MGKSSELHKNTQNSVLLGPPLPPKEKYPLEEAILPTKNVMRNATNLYTCVSTPKTIRKISKVGILSKKLNAAKMPQIYAKISFRAFLFTIQESGLTYKDWLQKCRKFI